MSTKGYRTKSRALKRKTRRTTPQLIERKSIIRQSHTFLLNTVLEEFPKLKEIDDQLVKIVCSFKAIFDIVDEEFVGQEASPELNRKFTRLSSAVVALNNKLRTICEKNNIIESYLKGLMTQNNMVDFKCNTSNLRSEGEA